jgi:restriction system protein
MINPSALASTAGAGLSLSDKVGIITAVLTLLTVVAAVVAIVYAKRSAEFAAISLEEARRLRLLDLLSDQTSILEKIVDTIATMIWIPNEVESSKLTGDPFEWFDRRFNQERRKLVVALTMLPSVELPKCRTVANIRHWQDALPDLDPAGDEANQALTKVLREREEEARKPQESNKANTVVATELLDCLRQREPVFLERLVLSLLTSMDYDSAARAAEHHGKVGDEGLDGAVRLDDLPGQVRIYVQANRYGLSTAVGQQEILKFFEALREARADGGIFVTTSRFTPEAIAYADEAAAKVVLIDGLALSNLIVSS